MVIPHGPEVKAACTILMSWGRNMRPAAHPLPAPYPRPKRQARHSPLAEMAVFHFGHMLLRPIYSSDYFSRPIERA